MTPATVCLALFTFLCMNLNMSEALGQSPATDTYYDLGNFERQVSTDNPAAAQWFVRGLIQSYGFNHEEAVRCYEKALELDPDMAMAYWGIGHALGPNYNNPVLEPEAAKPAFDAVQKASELSGSASAVEKSLISALATRYVWPATEDREPLEKAYADAMRQVRRKHPDDPDVAALTAEAIMMLRPWQLWSSEGEAAPETPEIQKLLEQSLERWPQHMALCHLYIHTMEPSPTPEKALPAANRLRNLVPDAGHLLHMPSHIDVLLGDYDRVIESNLKGIEADKKFVAREGRLNFYTLYRMHNYHFLVYGAMFDGQRQLAMEAANTLVKELPDALLKEIPDFVEAFVPTPIHVQVRFGLWNDILRLSEPPAEQPFTRAIWHYARTLALASLSRVEEAQAELELLRTAASRVPESRILFNNACSEILKIAIAMSEGEVAYRAGQHEVAFKRLRHAVQLDDALNYDEPWGWMQPARHALGALLLEQGHVAEAENVYREDLERHPRNGWALHGLAEALERQGQTKEAIALRGQLSDAWSRSDTKLTASCFCRIGKTASR